MDTATNTPAPSDLTVGQWVETYDGPGKITRIEPDAFYGKGADGYRYDVFLAGQQRVGSYDRSRLRAL